MSNSQIIKEIIENKMEALFYNYSLSINVSGNNVIVTGKVNSVDEKEIIEKIALNTFGVLSVQNELSLIYK